MISLTFGIEAKNNNSNVIDNEFWKYKSYNGIHFIMYYFSKDGTFIQCYGYSGGMFLHTAIRGKYFMENNLIKLEIIKKQGIEKYMEPVNVNSLIIEIVKINDDTLEIDFPAVIDGGISSSIVFNRYKNMNEEDILKKHFGIFPF